MQVASDYRLGGASVYLLNLLAPTAVWREDGIEVACPPGGELAAALEERGWTVHPLPERDRSRSPELTTAVREILRRGGPFDVVHTHGSLSGRIAARAEGVPCIVTTNHGPDGPPPDPGSLWGRLRSTRLALSQPAMPRRGSLLPASLTRSFQAAMARRWTDRIVAVSQAVADTLIGNGVPANMVRVVPNGIDPAPFGQAEPLERSSGPLLGVVARLVPEKGHRLLLEAVSSLGGEFPDLQVWVAGEGPLREELEREARVRGLAERVRFLGLSRDIPRILATLDLLVLPSFVEGMPLVLLEAMAAGRAVVATAVGGSPEVVADGETGVLVPPGDGQSLVRAIRHLLADPALRQRMGERGRERLLQSFGHEAMAARVRALYGEVLGQ